MNMPNVLPLALGLVIFSFLITSVLVVPFINLLYKLKLTRRKEAPKTGKVPLFDKLHDIKTGTPVGGGLLLVTVVSVLFAFLFPLASYLGVFVQTAFDLRNELLIIFFVFLSFGVLGLSDDLIKIFGRPTKGLVGQWFGLRRKHKFILQWALALIAGYLIYSRLGIHLIHIPVFNFNFDLGASYILF